MPRSAPLNRPNSSCRAVKSGIRIRPGFTLREFLSRPSSAAAAKSDSGFAIVAASAKLSPIETSVAMINICNIFSFSLRTSVSISPAALITATTPTLSVPCLIGVITPNQDKPSASNAFCSCVPCTKLAETKDFNCSSTDRSSSVLFAANGDEIIDQSQFKPSVRTVEDGAISSLAPMTSIVPEVFAINVSDGSKTKTSVPLRRLRPSKVASISTPSPVAKLTGTPVGNCTSIISAINSASLTNAAARCPARLSRDEFR